MTIENKSILMKDLKSKSTFMNILQGYNWINNNSMKDLKDLKIQSLNNNILQGYNWINNNFLNVLAGGKCSNAPVGQKTRFDQSLFVLDLKMF